ncbi:hypothetical protein CCAX7_53960 [Capsulimonas corticalis]|uniref:Uncharacterized protein n=1 Tax=Capsulimonas corticalis TaxID=2219043 RepID=A0A402CNA6_9BACT|nr:hypothetical protein [Capsulimonas corticalis]BDI33345.1 hypothetical protein CCAX7_53960 [Capsulimonas corticalis]
MTTKTMATDEMAADEAPVLTVKQQLDAQPKYRIRLRHELGKKDHKKEGALTVGVNGHFYFIKRGEYVDVPEEIYLILVRAGEVEAQKPEHEGQAPGLTTAPQEAGEIE